MEEESLYIPSKAISRKDEKLDVSGAILNNLMNGAEKRPTSFIVSKMEECDIDSNIFPLSLVEAGSFLNVYSVKFDPEPPKTYRLGAHYIYSTLFPDGGPRSQNPKWPFIIFDKDYHLFSLYSDLDRTSSITIHDDPATTKNVTITLDPELKKATLSSHRSLFYIFSAILRASFKRGKFENYFRRIINPKDTSIVLNFRIVYGVQPTLLALSHPIFKMGLCLDTIARIQRAGSLSEFLNKGVQLPSCRPELESLLPSMLVVTTHLKHPLFFKPSKILWDTNPQSLKFDRYIKSKKETVRISLSDYFMRVHHQPIKQSTPIIVFERHIRDKISISYFPANLLNLTGLTDAEQHVAQTMTLIRKETNLCADPRFAKLEAFVRNLTSAKNDTSESSFFLKHWGVEIQPSCLRVQGHFLPPPFIVFRKQNEEHTKVEIQPAMRGDFKGELKHNAVAIPPILHSKFLMVYPKSMEMMMTERLIPQLKDLLQKSDIRVPDADAIPVENVHANAYKAAITKYIQTEGNPIPSFIIIILSDILFERYMSIKHFLSVDLGIPSQCLRLHTIHKERNPKNEGFDVLFLSNVIFQLAAKTGGIGYHISPKYLPLKSTMIIGISINNDKGNNLPPVLGFVSTFDNTIARYNSRAISLENINDNSKIANIIEELTAKAIRKFGQPKRIVVYRECIRIREVQTFSEFEIPAIRKAIEQESPGTSLLYIAVKERTEIKFAHPNGSRKRINVQPGTIISGAVSAPGVADFYLLSHDPHQNFVSPTRYIILEHYPRVWEDNQIALMTHAMTFTYPSWAGVVRVPSATLLASKLASHVRNKLSGDEPNERLQNVLHFI